ncbi:membrane-associated PAP2 superfamily phosphatase [Pelomonas saccharophila]|uniref:Membrane-associated PAP2 superfamily phosphatase n=1 Tax=Roseateles saccharophilus TaxID=304 RepID=A0ABU1YQX6_ROSSA|nr:phosphatase PAP2 family protein [Roseateles saccharophilus]MDR7270620.1 membrane-associated PAP2 superfamily phosphatase [Roseateles saccharophilus]
MQAPTQNFLRPIAGLTLGLLLVLAWDASGLDLALARCFGDATGFAAREAFWSRDLLHGGLRWLWGVAWLGLAVDAWRRQPAQRGPSRRQRRQALAAGLLILLVVPALKALSHSSCPWSLQDFGGSAPWVSHWDWTLRDGGPGHCFPSGHTAGAAAFAPFAWIWGRRAWGLLALSAGLASVGQLARGAHFLSHVLWAAWICIALGWLLLRVMDGLAMRRSRLGLSG